MIRVLADVIFETPSPTIVETTIEHILKRSAPAIIDTPMDVIFEPPIEALLGSNWMIWLIAIIVGALAIGTIILILVLSKYKKGKK